MEKNYGHNALDLFRVLATVQVFLGHVVTHFQMSNPPTEAVYFIRGVPILFVLCGFLAAKSLDSTSSGVWLLRRAVRILPAFWMCIIINSLVIFLAYDRTPTAREGILYFATQFLGLNFYTGEWLRGYGVGTPNGVLWTIGVQLQFFLLAPLVHRFIGKNVKEKGWGIIIGALALFSIGCHMVSAYLPEVLSKLIGVTVFPYLYFLLLGMMGWYCRDKLIPLLERVKWPVLLIYMGWKLCEINFAWPKLFDGIQYNVVTTTLIGCVIFAFSFGWKWRMKRDWTYGFYLYHMVVINLLVEWGYTSLEPLWKGLILMAVIILVTLLLTVASKRWIETPAAAMLERKMKHG